MFCKQCNTISPDYVSKCLECGTGLKDIKDERKSNTERELNQAKQKVKLSCPHCLYYFELTWRVYLKAANGKFFCPSCNQVSILNESAVVLITNLLVQCTILFVAIWVGLLSDSLSSTLVLWLLGIIISIPLIKYIDQKWRKLVVITKKGL